MSLCTFCLALILAAAPASGPTVAREDTLTTQVPEVLVRAPRVTLDEILDRVARGEAQRAQRIQDQQFTATFRLVRAGGSRPAELLSERVLRIYKKRPDKVRTVTLREYDRDRGRRRAGVQIEFRPDMDEQIVNFAFRPAARREYTYRIVGRDFVGGHLIYRIAFTPRSALDPSQPSGTVWVDTNDFVIVRQEARFERSPVPLLIRDVRRMVIERSRVGSHWVLNRVLFRVETSIPVPRLGKLFDVTLRFDDYRINAGIANAFFEAGS